MTEDQPSSGHPSHTDTPSAATAAAQALSRLTDLLRVSLQTQASLAKQSVNLTWTALSGDMDLTSANKAYVESATREGARYWRTVEDLGIGYATDLIALGKSVTTVVLREVAAAGRKPDTRKTTDAAAASTPSTARHGAPGQDGPQTPTPSGATGHVLAGRRVTLSLAGSVGQRAEGTATVANQHPRPRRIQLSAAALKDSTGAAVSAALDISPAVLTVPGRQERSVTLGVDLDGASFSAGQRYSCTVDVSGGDEATIEVSVEVGA